MNRLLSFALTLLTAIAVYAAPAKYVFYFIGDGMGPGQVMAAWQYNRMVRGLDSPLLMTGFPVASLSSTYSASSPVTDSAAAGTALATGTKTINGMLGVSPDSAAVASVATRLHNDGYGVGIVTSVCADDATPGAFYAHQPSRKMFYEIGIDAANSGFEFIAGSDMRGWTDKEGRPTDLMERLVESGITVSRGPNGLRETESRKVMLLNSDSNYSHQLGYTIDSIPGALTLPVMTRECLAHLEKVSPDGFFMMVEGGNIDWAGHANDGGAVVKEILKFDESLRIAYDFYLAHPDETLIVVTADHETGGMSVGCRYTHYDAHPEYIDGQRVAKDTFADRVRAMLRSRRVYTWEDVKQILTDDLGFWTVVPITPEETARLEDAYEHTFIARDMAEQEALYKNFPYFVHVAFNILQDHCGFGWTTLDHSGNPVGVFAIGAGAELFNSFTDNTSIPRLIYEATGHNW